MPNRIEQNEKRGFTRIPFKTEAEVFVNQRVIRSAGGIDVSMKGLRLATDALVEPGTLCRAVIRLRGETPPVIIETAGTIVRSTPGSLAVEFIELDFDSYQHLRNLILLNAEDPEKAEREFIAHWGIREADR